ncbi:hypothetical protein E6O75_ATG03531 [Venturia nashicola]|uniref:SAC domain-containing protein n=1 Tax=Venturia nashicola TaxID=86259 RepID=A0A4Z1PBB8_9PEZI|nr:hypothetical protein E6O75_ATG03531 [Venturia nashicola]
MEILPDDHLAPADYARWREPPINDFASNTDSISVHVDDEDEEPREAKEFARSNSPAAMQRNKGAAYAKVGEEGVNKMSRWTLYETSARYFMVGQDMMEKHFRIMTIDRTAGPNHLNVREDDIVYDRREMNQLINTIEEGNKNAGGMKLKCSSWGLLGFIRFTDAYYMLLITKRSQVAMLGGHYVYQIEGTELIPLTTGSTSRFARDRNPEEARYLGILASLDLTKSFYFSYSYNITRTLQHNMTREREALNRGERQSAPDFNDMFVWNHHLLQPAKQSVKNVYDWCLPIIHGYIEQASIDVFSRRVYMTIIARRSRFFAGARYLKRGINDCGYVANDVETEQIVSNKLTTSFHSPGPSMYTSPCYTSHVQHRGSIPVYWTQDNTGVTPKPDIDVNLIDPFYTVAGIHFNDLFERYGSPVYVLNLVKQRERTPRERKLTEEYERALDFLNQSLPDNKKIQYHAFDMSRAAKSRDVDVIHKLEEIAEVALQKSGFFHNGVPGDDQVCIQNGVTRTNCIDCLDRTNAAQFVIGKRALGRQLHALGIIEGQTVAYDTDCVNTFTHMWHAHGDTIAIQYGGSHLVNTMSTYRKINEWRSNSRDLVESFKRYYHNSFLDSQRQEAYNLFLGNYIYTHGQPMLWDLPTDYYLHHVHPRKWSGDQKHDYIKWYNPDFLLPRNLPPYLGISEEKLRKGVEHFDDYWLEYYRPLALSSFAKIFSWKMSSRPRYLPDGSQHSTVWDPSPFVIRMPTQPAEATSPDKKPRKGVTILEPNNDSTRFLPSSHPQGSDPPGKHAHGILRESSGTFDSQQSTLDASFASQQFVPANKNVMHQWTLKQFYENSLNPSVTTAEEEEYEQYISHPLNIPLVISAEEPTSTNITESNLEFFEYVRSGTGFPRISSSQHLSRDGKLSFDECARELGDETLLNGIGEEDFADYAEFLTVSDYPLDVTEEDLGKKRYKAYRQWLRGKSLFKQSKVDPEAGR